MRLEVRGVAIVAGEGQRDGSFKVEVVVGASLECKKAIASYTYVLVGVCWWQEVV